MPGDLRMPGEPQRVLMLSYEDDPEGTLRPRLDQLGADLTRVKLIDGVDVDGTRSSFGPADVDVLAEYLASRRDVGLIARLPAKPARPHKPQSTVLS